MTNVEGLWLLFVALGLFVACLAVAGLLVAVLVWTREDGRRGRSLRIATWVAIAGVGLSVLSWLFAFAFVTPAGMVERAGRGNPVLFALLLGYTAPGFVGGYVLWNLQVATDRHPS